MGQYIAPYDASFLISSGRLSTTYCTLTCPFHWVLIADSTDEEHRLDLIWRKFNHFLNGDGNALNLNRRCLCAFYTLVKITSDIPG